MLHRLAHQRFLGPELTEDGDLVDTRGISNAASSRAAESVLRENASCCVQNLVSSTHGADFKAMSLQMQVVTYLHRRFYFIRMVKWRRKPT